MTSPVARLTQFHAANKLLLLAHSESTMRELGRLLANNDGLTAAELEQRYHAGFEHAMKQTPRRGHLVNALLHGFGLVSDQVSAEERAEFVALVERFGAGERVGGEAVARLRRWAEEYGAPWLAGQTLLGDEGRRLVEG